MVLYLHGFLSSPGSTKARQMRQALADRGRAADFLCPQLPASPRSAAELVLALAQLEDPGELCVVGSSLGGFYATWLAERTGCRAVLLNPAIRPYELLQGRLGWQTDTTGQPAEIRPEFMDELRALETGAPAHPERLLLVAATGDEIIDYRTMVERYAHCPQRIVDSDHALSEFAAVLPEVLRFCGLTPAT